MNHKFVLRVSWLVYAGMAFALTPSESLDLAQAAREERLLSYTVTEHYVLKNARFGTSAELVANVTYRKGSGKTYDVVSRTGSQVLHNKVLKRILAEEAEMSSVGERKTLLLTSANYEMRAEGEEMLEGRRCFTIALTPHHKSTHLLKGRLWVDAVTSHVVRIQGSPEKSPSFWVGKAKMSRDYADIGDFAFAQHSRAVLNSMLAGTTELTIDYTNYRIQVAENQ